nr:MAG TPA: hypothetical protein [Bacteriophage sp.]
MEYSITTLSETLFVTYTELPENHILHSAIKLVLFKALERFIADCLPLFVSRKLSVDTVIPSITTF